MRIASITIVSLLLLGSIAHAQSSPASPSDSPPVRAHHRNRDAAIALGMFATAASLVAVGSANLASNSQTQDNIRLGALASLVLTPSLGHLYANDWMSDGLLLRLAGAAVVAGGAYIYLDEVLTVSPSFSRPSDAPGLAMMGIGTAAVIGGAVWDLATAGSAVDEFNRVHALAITPTAMSSLHGTVAGIGLSARF